MQKSKIEWTDFVWNPIKGLCPVNCKLPDGKSYCYAKAIYNRFEWMQEDIGEFGYLAEWELEQPIKRKKPTKIFVCSTFELFHPCTKSIRDAIFKTIESCPQHTFQILTKFPENIDRPMPDNVWLGVSITNPRELPKVGALNRAKAELKFISFEPLLESIDPRWGLLRSIKWVIIGRLTGHGKKYDPTEIQLNTMFTRIRATVWSPPIFLKDNLKSIWGENLIQEMPGEKNI